MGLFIKIAREVGVAGLLRTLVGLTRCLWHAVVGHSDRLAARLREDRIRLVMKPYDFRREILAAWGKMDAQDPYAQFRGDDSFIGLSYAAAYAASCRSAKAAELTSKMGGAHQPAWYHTYGGLVGANGGKNDHWEWHLVPWLRAAADYCVAALHSEFDEATAHISSFYREELKHTPWMSAIPVGSNVMGVNAGRAAIALIEYAKSHDPAYIDIYEQSVLQFVDGAEMAFDVTKDSDGRVVSVPMEGLLYGTFFWQSALVLGLMQKALGLWSVLDMPQLVGLPRYMELTEAGNGYLPLGDSHEFSEELPNPQWFAIMRAMDPYVRAKEAEHPSYHFMREVVR